MELSTGMKEHGYVQIQGLLIYGIHLPVIGPEFEQVWQEFEAAQSQ